MLKQSELLFARVVGVAAVLDAAAQADDIGIGPDRLRVPVEIVGLFLPTPTLPRSVAIAIGLGWLIGGLLLVAGRVQTGALAVVVSSGVVLLLDQQLFSNHTFAVWSLCLLLAVAWSEPPLLRVVVRSQITVVYVFAALSKLRAPWWSGDILRRSADGVIGLPIARDLPDRSLAALAIWVVVVELALAVMTWWNRPVAFVVAVLFHLGVVAVVGMQMGLVVFGVAMLSQFALPTSASTSHSAGIPPSPPVAR